MSELLKPFTQFIENSGFDPLLFAIGVMLIIIFVSRKDYTNWKKQSKHRKEVLVLTIVGLIMMILAWFIVNY